jgi:hypothetical protein
LSFAKERIGPLAAIVTTVFYFLALYLLVLPNTLENLFASIYSDFLIKTAHQHLLLLVGFDTLIYRKYYDTPPILVGHQGASAEHAGTVSDAGPGTGDMDAGAHAGAEHEVDHTGSRAGTDPDVGSDSDSAGSAGSRLSTDPGEDSAGESSTPDNSATPPPPLVILSPIRTRLQRGIRNPKKYTDGTVRYGMLSSTGEPCTLMEALDDENWCKAMNEEY